MNQDRTSSVNRRWRPAPRQPFGAYLRERRIAVNLIQREAGEQIGMTAAYICQIETGRREPPAPKLLIKFAEVYEVPLAELLSRAGYLHPLDRRAQRLWKRDQAAVKDDPSVRPIMERKAQDSERFRAALMSISTYGAKSFEATQDAFAVLRRMYEKELTAALSDPDITCSKYFRKKNPRLRRHVRGIIIELYILYRSERERREALEMHFLGEVVDPQRWRDPVAR